MNMATIEQPFLGEDFARKLSSRISDLEKALEYYTGHVMQLEKHISKCIHNKRGTASALVKLESEHASLCNYTKSLENYCLELDVGLHKKHLLLTEIPQTEEENRGANWASTGENANNENSGNEAGDGSLHPTYELVLATLSNLQDTILFDDVDIAYRIGRMKGTTPDLY